MEITEVSVGEPASPMTAHISLWPYNVGLREFFIAIPISAFLSPIVFIQLKGRAENFDLTLLVYESSNNSVHRTKSTSCFLCLTTVSDKENCFEISSNS